jgi:hypothetical protein
MEALLTANPERSCGRRHLLLLLELQPPPEPLPVLEPQPLARLLQVCPLPLPELDLVAVVGSPQRFQIRVLR